VQETNSWLSQFVVTADDFLSLDIDSASAPRQADGSLPEIEFLHLAQGSDLIDAGVILGYPYKGGAPDLGAFESDFLTSVKEYTFSGYFQLFQNYPNPFNPTTNISYSLPKPERVTLTVFNSLGQQLVTLIDSEEQRAGTHMITWNGQDKTGKLVSTGVYFYYLESESGIVKTRKMLLVK
jgi:hypothetical protein